MSGGLSVPGQAWRRVLILLAALATMGVTASLGLWQLGRAQQKQALAEQIRTRAALPPLSASELLAITDPLADLYRPVRLKGRWVVGANVFLDNRPMAGRTGFVLLTPLRLQGSERVLVVQRGWVPRDFQDRQKVPAVETPAGEVEIEGRLALPPSQLFELGEAGDGPIRQNVDLPAYARATGLPLLEGVSVQQTGSPGDGLLREWPAFAADVPKHHGYAFQWFAMCGLTGILYVWFQLILPRRRRVAHESSSR